jgi:DNA-directed RNA polymerase specialized sigma24 family protein
VAVRCCKFTNSKTQAERIALYALITTCLLAEELERLSQLGLLVEIMVDVVGQDIVGTEQERRPLDEADALLADERLRALAAALNRLDGFTRELVVLHHIAHMDVDALGRLYRVPPARISTQLRKGERELAVHLGARAGDAQGSSRGDPAMLLVQYAEGLPGKWIDGLGQQALAYLVECDTPHVPPRCPWRLN